MVENLDKNDKDKLPGLHIKLGRLDPFSGSYELEIEGVLDDETSVKANVFPHRPLSDEDYKVIFRGINMALTHYRNNKEYLEQIWREAVQHNNSTSEPEQNPLDISDELPDDFRDFEID